MNREEIAERFKDVTRAINGCTVNDGYFVLTMVLGGILAAAGISDEDAKEFAQAIANDVVAAYKDYKENGDK